MPDIPGWLVCNLTRSESVMIIPLKNAQKGWALPAPHWNRRYSERTWCSCLWSISCPAYMPKYPVPFEILIYYLRHSEIRFSQQHLQPVFTTFYSRVESALYRALAPAHFAHTASICDEIMEKLFEMIAQERNSQSDNMYYWEVNFNHALSNFRTDVLKIIGPARKLTLSSTITP